MQLIQMFHPPKFSNIWYNSDYDNINNYSIRVAALLESIITTAFV